MANLKMFFTKRLEGNMSLLHGSQIMAVRNRIRVSNQHDFSLFKPKDLGFTVKGFAPNLGHRDGILIIKSDETPHFNGKGIIRQSNISCDAVITDAIGFPLVFPNADCYVVMLYDNQKKILAVFHSGRDGTCLNIAGKTAKSMQLFFDCCPGNIKAHILPGICAACYFIDLQGEIIEQLWKSGIKNIYAPEGRKECTCCTQDPNGNKKYFSHLGHANRIAGHEERGNNALIVEMT